MKKLGLAALTLALRLLAPLPVAVASAPPFPPGSLAGLWGAQLRFPLSVQGELTLRRDRSGWHGAVRGATASAPSGETFALDFGAGKGRFSGWLDAARKDVGGHWIQPRTGFNGTAYATPVRFRRTGAAQWAGQIRPLPDALTLYLKIEASAEGTLRAFLRNPERNVGVFVNATRLVREGTAVRLYGMQGGREVEVLAGSYDPAADAMEFRIPPLGGTFVFRRANPASGFYPRGENPGRQGWHRPAHVDDGWSVSSPEDVGLSRPRIENFVQMLADTKIDSVHALEIHAFLLARHGRLVVEEYFHGFTRDTLHDTRSASKSVTAVLAGAAEHAGFGVSSRTPVYAAMNGGLEPAGLDPRRSAMTLEHLLTMAPGLACNDSDGDSPGNENTMQGQGGEPDWYRYTMALPMSGDPGGAAAYCSGGANLAGGVTARTSRRTLLSMFESLLARPLGIRHYAVNLMPTGEAYGGGGLHIKPRDFMKVGQLMLDRGNCGGRRIVDAGWVARATSPLKSLAGVGYGYLWWVTDLPAGDGHTVRAFYAGGNGGQVMMVIPELELVAAFFGGNYGDPIFYVPQREYVPKFVLPMVVTAPRR